jgi:hypothetical protein
MRQELENGRKCRDEDCDEPITFRVTTVARELARCRLDFLHVQKVRCEKFGSL